MHEMAMFGAGCFWGVEERFRTLNGVVDTNVGYSGGMTQAPSYEEVCTGATEHAEVVRIEFDPELISYEQLLEVFWNSHNPTEWNRQGPDEGSQYRSVIFYYNEEQREMAEKSKEALITSKRFDLPVVTLIEKASEFFMAEEYHQKYLFKKGKTSCGL